MKRRNFLASIAAVFAAPFVAKEIKKKASRNLLITIDGKSIGIIGKVLNADDSRT